MRVLRTSLETPETADTEEPISIADVKRHLVVDTDIDDDLIWLLINVARDYAESESKRCLIARTATMTLDQFPRGLANGIVLPYGKAQSVTSVVYRDSSGAQVTLSGSASPSVFQVDLTDEAEPVIMPLRDEDWPTADERSIDPIVITWEAGYGAAADVPHLIRHAMALQVAKWYEARSDLEIPKNVTREGGQIRSEFQRVIGFHSLQGA